MDDCAEEQSELFSEQIERETTERFCALIQRLLAEGRHEDIAQATSDKEYLEKLYIEFQL